MAFETLELDETATLSEVKSAYRRLALKWHPDKSGDDQKFQELAAAYEALVKSVPTQRRRGKSAEDIFAEFFATTDEGRFFTQDAPFTMRAHDREVRLT